MKKKQLPQHLRERQPSGCVFVEDTPAWVEWIVPEKFNNWELFRIVVFFVFHSPCVGTSSTSGCPSAMGKPITEYGWSEKWGNYRTKGTLNNTLRNACSNFAFLFSATGNNDMLQACQKADLCIGFPHALDIERVAISISDKNQFLSLFRHIRNAFSHGRINMHEMADGDLMFIFEDIGRKKPEGIPVSARMLLRKSTLLKWIDIIEAGPQASNEEVIFNGKG